MIYALIGIPMSLLMLTALVDRTVIITSRLLKYLLTKMDNMMKSFYIHILHLTIITSIVATMVIFLPALIFYNLEREWSYPDSVYYCVISMTTIGLGDFVPGEDYSSDIQKAVYKVLVTLYMFMGLILVLANIATICQIPQINAIYRTCFKPEQSAAEQHLLEKSGEYKEPDCADNPEVCLYFMHCCRPVIDE